MVTPFCSSCISTSTMSLSTTRSMVTGSSDANWMTASRRLRNSGVKARTGGPLRVLGEAGADELDTHRDRQLARDLGVAAAGRAGEQEAAVGLAPLAEAQARHLDGGGECLDGLVLSEDHALQVALE